MLLLLTVLACSSDPQELPCRDGFTRAPSGHCYADGESLAPDTFDELFSLLPPCEGLRPSSLMDLESGCAGDFCQGDLYEVAVLKMGEPEDCFVSSNDVYCSWRNGLGGRWDDEDANEYPDATARNQRVQVRAPWVGATRSGLRISIPNACFIDVLGPPDETVVVNTEDGLLIDSMAFDEVGLLVYDRFDRDGRSGADGLVESLYLYGAP